MPSRRRTRRTPRSLRRPLHTKPAAKIKAKAFQKPRLVRRYMRRKPEDAKAHSRHMDASTLTHVPSQDKDKTKIPAQKSPVVSPAHNAVAVERKTASIGPFVAEITAIPNPTPDTGTNSTNTVGAGSPLLGAIPSVTMSTGSMTSTIPTILTASPARNFLTTSFSALPPLLSLATTSSVTTTQYTRAYLPTPTVLPSMTSQPADLKSHQITAAVVILLSVGSSLLLLGACIIAKMCFLPSRRHPRPIPSLPLLKDIEADEEYFETKELDESPIFGGEARMSSTAGTGGPIWTWVQYPHAKNPPSSVKTFSQDNTGGGAYPDDSQYGHQYPLANQTFTAQMTETPSVHEQVLHNIPAAVASTSKRLSMTAALYNPNTTTHEPIGTNGRQETVLTADGHNVLKRSKSKAGNRRSRQAGSEERRYRDSATSFIGLAYDAEVAPPSPVDYVQPIEIPADIAFEGRARVRSGYFAAGTYPRISTMPSASYSIATATRINLGQRNSFSKEKFSLQRTNSKRLRDTQALTYALGLASPRTEYGAPSPQPTLYPEDSMSVADPKRPKKRNVAEKRAGEAVPDVPVIVPMQQEGGSTGTLMGMDFGVSQMSLSGLALDVKSEATEREPVRNADKPPRVPSPPPLLSLAQMGLEQHNPEAFANYRSPTYSLYGLYEAADNRKSFVR
ncbi:hypothetical protein GALMADRAFT_239809 [Galerina marginata CBS 339.88]|uniref:Transmembrane protein n=1 Tax=Galerina marginata (strain CBS 339.88) TaxID=685588 RepID=A0A067TEU7_GALM3|nr:hypothetical protein GALMADRAFT_239809 [Galerina marginata CBS 339.88]